MESDQRRRFMAILEVALEPATVVVAVDPGKVLNRVWISNGAGLLEDPVSLPVSREGVGRLERLLGAHAAAEGPVIAIEATGSNCGSQTRPPATRRSRMLCPARRGDRFDLRVARRPRVRVGEG